MPAISWTLSVDGTPAGPDLLAAIQQIEVEDNADLADMLRLRVSIAPRDGCADWTVVDEDLFGRLANLTLTVAVGSATRETLIDAYAVDTQASFANQPGQSVLNVTAMDPTVLMNLAETVRPWPDVADSDIATTLFDEHGFSPQIEATTPTRPEADVVTMQRGTDIRFLHQLARRNGYECYVEVNPSTGLVEGHFHPPRLDQPPQGVLTVNMDRATNVDSFDARYDMLRPTKAQSVGLDIASREDQQAEVDELGLTTLGGTPALDGDRPRQVLLARTGLSQTGELQTHAQAVVDRSGWAITADGELNTVAYGAILRAKRPVLVRGAGRQFSGTWYVQAVRHTFTADGYTQRFSLRRNALALTGQERFTDDLALP